MESFITSRPVLSMYFQSEWKTLWILIRWFCQKLADLDLQCFQKSKNLGSALQGLIILQYCYMGFDVRKHCLRMFANNTAADQPAHPCSLISAFIIHYLESIICKLAIGEISIF